MKWNWTLYHQYLPVFTVDVDLTNGLHLPKKKKKHVSLMKHLTTGLLMCIYTVRYYTVKKWE